MTVANIRRLACRLVTHFAAHASAGPFHNCSSSVSCGEVTHARLKPTHVFAALRLTNFKQLLSVWCARKNSLLTCPLSIVPANGQIQETKDIVIPPAAWQGGRSAPAGDTIGKSQECYSSVFCSEKGRCVWPPRMAVSGRTQPLVLGSGWSRSFNVRFFVGSVIELPQLPDQATPSRPCRSLPVCQSPA